MDPIQTMLYTKAINGAFSLIASFRRRSQTTIDINARLDAVDAGGDAVSLDEVKAANDEWQDAIDAGRGMD